MIILTNTPYSSRSWDWTQRICVCILQTVAQNGAFDLDGIGDAVKEFSIRAIDGSDTTKQGFEALGMNADEMAQKFGAGGKIRQKKHSMK
ncbi:MAG: hypothetical protein ACLRIT_05410 [Blautia sp.]